MPDRKYDVFGPFKIPRTENRQRVDRRGLRDFWNEVETLRQRNESLASASGCYIFAIRAGKGAKPWYVGQATKTFRQECFTPHKPKSGSWRGASGLSAGSGGRISESISARRHGLG